MRQLPLPLLFIAAVVSIFMACKKEPLLESSSELGRAKDGMVPGDVRPDGKECEKNSKVECGMLSFVDQDHYQEVYDCLEAAYEAHLDAFEAQYGYLSEDDYDDMADELGFVDEQPLIDFEAALGFTSYRAWYSSVFATWLDSGGHPADFSIPQIVNGEVQASLRNESGAVMIGGVIHLIDPVGRAWTFCSCESYELYLTDPSAFENYTDDCVSSSKQIFEGNGFFCSDNWRQCWWDEYVPGSKGAQMKLVYVYGGIGVSTEAWTEVSAFRRKNGRWKPRRLQMKVRVDGRHSTTECAFRTAFDVCKPINCSSTRRRKKLAVWHATSGHNTFKDDEVRGTWTYGPSPIVRSFTLNFTNGTYSWSCGPV